MNSPKRFPIPPVLLALDVFGVLIVLVGVLALSGNDLGHPVLREVAPGLVTLGVALMVPMIVWIVRNGGKGRK